jgi:hypothetical protein
MPAPYSRQPRNRGFTGGSNDTFMGAFMKRYGVWRPENCRNVRIAAGALGLFLCLSCGKTAEELAPEPPGVEAESAGTVSAGANLEAMAEIERAGGYVQGMGLAESVVREEAGDPGGAVIAAFKDLAWTYAYGGAQKADMEKGLNQVLELYEGADPPGEEADRGSIIRAIRGTLAFLGERWAEAEQFLRPFAEAGDAPDAFPRWMLLVCGLEGGENSPALRGAYGAIQARYGRFPEYWYRGARSFGGAIAVEYAERCINLSPRGPFAEECRDLIALSLGIPAPGGKAVRTRAEIEALITQSAEQGDPERLRDLFPLMALPDNAYTLSALGALRALRADSRFQDFFTRASALSTGRLAERLAYVSRG